MIDQERKRQIREIYERQVDRVYRIASIYTGDPHDAEDVAESVLNMLKQRVVGDYMQTAAILDRDFNVLSGVNTPNDYMGPGTGYRVEGKRWEEIKNIPHLINPKDI